jgi:hypothetical protein
MTTPPARVALRRCSMVNLSLRKALVIKVAMQLPLRDKIVLMMIWDLVYSVVANTPQLKEGQYIHRNRVPTILKMFEL